MYKLILEINLLVGKKYATLMEISGSIKKSFTCNDGHVISINSSGVKLYYNCLKIIFGLANDQ